MGLFDWLFRKPNPQPETSDAPPPGRPPAVPAERLGPTRPLVYMFQHVALREAAFENHPELLRELAGEARPMPLLHFRSRALVRCIDAGLIPPDAMDDDDAMDAAIDLFDPVAVHSRRRGGYTVFVVTMPTPESCPEAHFAAIVHKDDEPHEYMRESPSTHYFTLERSEDAGRLPVLCEWTRDGTHLNFGEGPPPELEAFARVVFNHVLGG